ncbi:MAG: hypothetical protein JWN14_2107 [Chthonomonadales bacterium]|nr:hypothetical protein [Chthonomonadales bacterium]
MVWQRWEKDTYLTDHPCFLAEFHRESDPTAIRAQVKSGLPSEIASCLLLCEGFYRLILQVLRMCLICQNVVQIRCRHLSEDQALCGDVFYARFSFLEAECKEWGVYSAWRFSPCHIDMISE